MTTVGPASEVDGDRRGRAARDRAVADVRQGPAVYAYFTAGRGQPDRPHDRRARPADQQADLRRHPVRADPQRRPDRVRPGRHALRRHRRGRPPARRAQDPDRPRRQDPADDPGRRAGARATRSRARRSGRSATATCRGWPGTRAAGCGRASSARTPGTSSTCIVPGEQLRLADRRGRGHAGDAAVTATRSGSGTPTYASPSGIAIADGSVFMAALRGERLWQIPLTGDRTGTPRALLIERYGRLRAVAVAPDGSLWVLTNNTDGRGSPRQGDDRIVRLTVYGLSDVSGRFPDLSGAALSVNGHRASADRRRMGSRAGCRGPRRRGGAMNALLERLGIWAAPAALVGHRRLGAHPGRAARSAGTAFGGEFVNDYSVPGSQSQQRARRAAKRLPGRQRLRRPDRLPRRHRARSPTSPTAVNDDDDERRRACRTSCRATDPLTMPARRRCPRTAPSPTARLLGRRARLARRGLPATSSTTPSQPARKAGLTVEYGGGAGQIGQAAGRRALGGHRPGLRAAAAAVHVRLDRGGR